MFDVILILLLGYFIEFLAAILIFWQPFRILKITVMYCLYPKTCKYTLKSLELVVWRVILSFGKKVSFLGAIWAKGSHFEFSKLLQSICHDQ